jgi:carbonic anhydrase
VVAPAFKSWEPAFWENLAASIQLHHIPKVIVINHRDCGAAKIAYGADKVANPQNRDAQGGAHGIQEAAWRTSAEADGLVASHGA